MTDRRGYRLTGRVQGVGFRWWTRQTASDLDLRGTVRNARDGSVEVDVTGKPDRLDDFERLLRSGPPSARVEDVSEVDPGNSDLPDSFEIVR